MYYYYACRGKRKGHSCKKQNVNREFIEKFIATALKETMLNDRAIRILADTAAEYQSKKAVNTELEALQHRLQEIKKATGNLVAAIEAGIFSATTQVLLAELEAEQRTVTTQLSYLQEEAEGFLTREEIIATLQLFQNGDLCDVEFREALIDTFLVAAYVYDDEVKIVFNLGGKRESSTLPFDIEDVSFSDTSPENCQLHQTQQRRTPVSEVRLCSFISKKVARL